MDLYNTGDGKVDPTEAWAVIDSVAQSGIEYGTLHSVTLRPNEMAFDVSFAVMQDGVFTKATAVTPQTYTWTSLFPNHDSVSVLSSILPLIRLH